MRNPLYYLGSAIMYLGAGLTFVGAFIAGDDPEAAAKAAADEDDDFPRARHRTRTTEGPI